MQNSSGDPPFFAFDRASSLANKASFFPLNRISVFRYFLCFFLRTTEQVHENDVSSNKFRPPKNHDWYPTKQSSKKQVSICPPEFQKKLIFGTNRIRQFAIFWWQPIRLPCNSLSEPQDLRIGCRLNVRFFGTAMLRNKSFFSLFWCLGDSVNLKAPCTLQI